MQFLRISTLIALSLLLSTGCGQFGGGASFVANVTVLPPDLVVGGDDDSTASNDRETASSSSGGADVGTGFGAVNGQVILSGTAPELAVLIAAGADVKDKEVCAAVDLPDERLVLGEGNGVANVFVFLPKAPKGGKALEIPSEPVLFDQKGCRFLPHALVIPVGQTVKVLSGDAIAHNTHTNPAKNDPVNSGVSPNDRDGKLSFQYRRAESVPFGVTCDYHGWMKAWHLPVDHPYAAVTDANGNFTIADLPPGTHAFAVWHESVDGNFVERKLSVVVKPGETTDVKIDLPVAKLKL